MKVSGDGLLSQWSEDDVFPTLERFQSAYNPMHSFVLPKGEEKQYMQQYADTYYLRLLKLKPFVEALAADEWEDLEIAGARARRVERVLDVRQGQLCWVAGTVYMDLPLKPNILEDISKEHWIAAPPPRKTYLSTPEEARIMLEDESGRLCITGAMLKTTMLVTGIIVAVLGTENANGEFDVLDILIADLPRQPQRWERDDSKTALEEGMDVDHDMTPRHIVLTSGLNISSTEAHSVNLSLLSEYLLGEALASEGQTSAARFSRLIIAGNSISPEEFILPMPDVMDTDIKLAAQKKYGYDSSLYNPTPIAHLDEFLSGLLPSIPITIMPGSDDPASASLPQQSVHPSMLPRCRTYAFPHLPNLDKPQPDWLDSVTNPWDGDVEGWRLMGNSGQPVDDILKYIDLKGDDGTAAESRLEIMENILRWRCGAPTAPDTLWCYPFQDKDQFVIDECPHVYFVGNQPRFGTTVIEGPTGQQVRLIAIPKFHETGEIVLLDTETLEVELVKISIEDELDNHSLQ